MKKNKRNKSKKTPFGAKKRNRTGSAHRLRGRPSDHYRSKNPGKARSKGSGKEKSKILECTFDYSGRGYGFARADGADGDIFIPAAFTMGAMTNDTVSVSVSEGALAELFKNEDTAPSGNSVHAEGKVVEITNHACTSVAGVVKTCGAMFYIEPKNDKLRVNIEIVPSEESEISWHEGDLVEVRPVRDEYFVRRVKKTRSREEIPLRGKVVKCYGRADTKDANHSSGIPTEFSAEALSEAERVSQRAVTADGRVDLRKETIFTLDGADAKDLDDAVSLKRDGTGYVLCVHIADVSSYVTMGSHLEKDALARGTSVYFTDKVIPMLPTEISNGCCSLNEKTDKYTITAEIALDENGVRKSAVFYKSVINSSLRGVYSEANDVLEKGDGSEFAEKYGKVLPSLKIMEELYRKLLKNAKDRGEIELAESEAVIVLGEDGYPTDIRKRERGTAERIIEQFMLEANMAAAHTANALGIPFIYRVHEDPSHEKLCALSLFVHNLGLNSYGISHEDTGSADKGESLHKIKNKDNRVDKGGKKDATLSGSAKTAASLMKILADAKKKGIEETVSSVMLRSMMKAKYQSTPARHFALCSDEYCHFTSPIRRYPDLFVHTSLSAAIEAAGGRLSADSVLDFSGDVKKRISQLRVRAAKDATSSTDCEIRAVSAERQIEALYIALYMSDKTGEEFDAVVSSVTSFGMFIRLANTAEGLVPLSSVGTGARADAQAQKITCSGALYTIGTAVRVRLENADLTNGKLTFSLT